MTIFTNQEISHKYLDVWLFLKSGKIWLLCAPSLVWQQRAFAPTLAPGQAPFWRKPVPSWWITSVPTTSCYCVWVRMSAGGWLYPLTLPAFLQKAFGFLTSTLSFVFPEISSLPFPVAPNFSLLFPFLTLRVLVLLPTPDRGQSQLECSCWELSNYFVQKYVSGTGNIVCPCAWKIKPIYT